MPLTPAPSAAPSKRPYAFDLSTLSYRENSGWWACEAIWLGRKAGATRLSWGEFRFWWPAREADCHDPNLDWATLREHADARYGGTPWYIAGGDGSFWVNPASGVPALPLDEQPEVRGRLLEFLAGAPGVPAGFDGWYRLG